MRLAVAAAVVCLSMVGLAVAADAQASIKMQMDIPAQGLGPALKALAKDRGFQVVFRTEVVGSARTHGASGDLTTPEALTRLLEGTSLTYSYLDENTVTILPRAELESVSAVDRQSAPTGSGSSPGGDNKEGQKRNSFRLAQVDPGSSSGAASLTSAPTSTASGGLSEIIVTAQKRSERLQDVPVPITVLNADDLADHGDVLLKDYFSSVPGLSFQPSIIGSSNLAIRGITTSGFTNPTVGITVDDVPYGASTEGLNSGQAPDIDPGDLARIEVLRGPQGTLYGANSMGGLIKFVTKDPSTEGFSGRVETGTSEVRNGSQPGYSLRASANVPLGETVAFRASAFTRQDPGYIDNPSAGVNGVNETQNFGGRLAGLWRPSESFSVRLNALYQQSKTLGSSQVEILLGLGDLQQSDLKDSGGYRRTVQAYSATVDYQVHNVEMTSVTGYNIGRTYNSIDYTSFLGTCCTQPVSLASFGVGVTGTLFANVFNVNKFTQEVRAKVAIGPADVLLGGFYTHEGAPKTTTTVIAEDNVTAQVAGILFRESFTGPASRYEDYAGFATLTYHVTDKFDIQVGGRESWDRESDTPRTDTGPFVPILDGVAGSSFVSSPLGAKGDAFTYLFTPRLLLSPDLMIYGRLASGYRLGSPNTISPERLALGVPAASSPDKTQNYEVGVKADFLEHRVSIDASIFYIDWKNIQLQLLDGQGVAYNANGGSARSDGAEFSVSTRPLRGLSISAWVDYTDAVLTSNFPSNGSAFGLSGDRLPLSSRFSGSVSAEKDFSLFDNVIGFVGGEVSYVGNRIGQFQGWADAAKTLPLTREYFPAYAKTNLQLGIKDDLWKVSLYANNLMDKRGVLNAGAADLYNPNATLYITPRTVGLSVVRTF